MTLPYPPPYQDLHTLALHLCLGESTVEAWVARGLLPKPYDKGGKRLWKWKEVEKYLARRQADEEDLTSDDRIREVAYAASRRQ